MRRLPSNPYEGGLVQFDALWRLCGVPFGHRTDSLSEASINLITVDNEDVTKRYKELYRYYGWILVLFYGQRYGLYKT